MPEKKQVVVVLLVLPLLLLLFLLLTILAVPEGAFAIVPTAPFIFVEVEPISQDVQAGGSAIFNVSVIPEAAFNTANITLSLVDPPQGVTAVFNPDNRVFTKEGVFNSSMTVKVAADAPQGKQIIKVRGAGSAFAASDPTTPQRIDSTNYVTINITASSTKTTTTTTTTTSTTTVTRGYIENQSVTTLILTNTTTVTTTEGATDPSTYAWAVSATVAAIILAVILLLSRRRTG